MLTAFRMKESGKKSHLSPGIINIKLKKLKIEKEKNLKIKK